MGLKFDWKNFVLDFLGVFLLVLWTIDVHNTLQRDPTHVLWISYFMMALIAIGVLARSSLLLLSCVNIVGISYMIWTIDFFYYFIFDRGLFGIVDYLFIYSGSNLDKFLSLQHLFLIPIALFALYFLKIKKNDAWKSSLILVTVMFAVSRILTPASENVNCVFESCLYFQLPTPIYILIWFATFALMIFVTNAIMTRLKIFKAKSNQRA